MKINYKRLIICILIPVLTGGLSALLTMNNMNIYDNINLPKLSPPGIIFPIVWTILYILMGISLYFVSLKSYDLSEKAQKIFVIQLILNFIWSIIFFNFKNFILAFIVLILLWIFILKMILSFYKLSAFSGILQIPYLLWVFFAGYLNLMIIILN